MRRVVIIRDGNSISKLETELIPFQIRDGIRDENLCLKLEMELIDL